MLRLGQDLKIRARFYGGPEFILTETRSNETAGTLTKTVSHQPTSITWAAIADDQKVLRECVAFVLEILQKEMSGNGI